MIIGKVSALSTTTNRIETDMKARAAAAARAGKTPHAFILDAIAQTVEQDEIDAAFHRVADERWANIVATGQTIPWYRGKVWLGAKACREHPPRPAPRPLAT